MNGKGLPNTPRRPVGLDEIDVPSNETNQPPNFFAGIAKLNVTWIMVPIITHVTNSGSGKGK